MDEVSFRAAHDPNEDFLGREDQEQSGSEGQKYEAKEDEGRDQIAHGVKRESGEREGQDGGRFENVTRIFRLHGRILTRSGIRVCDGDHKWRGRLGGWIRRCDCGRGRGYGRRC